MTPHSGTVELVDQQLVPDEVMAVVLDGLSQSPKTLPCKLLYDERGSELFEQICELEEYYLTRTELAIFEEHLADMAAALGPQCAVIEYGSGSSMKSRMLLHTLDDPVAYVPIDISREILLESSVRLNEEFPGLEVLPVCADYTQTISHPEPVRRPRRYVVFFPGSTIGNFHLPEAEDFLRRSAQLCGEGGGMLIGVDLRKDRRIIERAYNDSAGVTARFTLNMLARINREIGSDFDLDQFRHRAVFNEEDSRIEAYLVSQVRQTVRVDSAEFDFEKGEAMRIEVSYKYELPVFAALAERAGYCVRNVWTDEKQMFSVQYLETSKRPKVST